MAKGQTAGNAGSRFVPYKAYVHASIQQLLRLPLTIAQRQVVTTPLKYRGEPPIRISPQQRDKQMAKVDFGNCSKCGHTNSHSASKCHACGATLPWAPQPKTQAKSAPIQPATPAPPATPPVNAAPGGVGPGSNAGFCPHCGAATIGIVSYCSSCGKAIFSSSGKKSPSDPNTGSVLLRVLGGLMLAGGLLATTYFFLFFDTTVAVPTTEIFGTEVGGGRVNNIGLMADRQNGIIFGLGIAVLGVILMYMGRSRE